VNALRAWPNVMAIDKALLRMRRTPFYSLYWLSKFELTLHGAGLSFWALHGHARLNNYN